MFRCLIIFFLVSSMTAHAARPMVTDDARLTKGGSCQLESWAKTYSGGNEFWALPACNPTGNLEVTLGYALSKANNQSSSGDFIVQAKTIFKELTPNGWGLGFAIGTAQHESELNPGPNGIGSSYLYFPISHSFFNDKLITHLNLGYIHYKNTAQDSMTWGYGGEYKLKDNLLYVLEAFGDHRTSPYIQTGLRYSVIPDIFQIDTTIGRRLSPEAGEWLSVGIRYTPDKFF